MLTWMECLVTDSTVIATAAYFEAEAIRTGHCVHRTVVGPQSSRVPTGTEQVTRVADSLQGMATPLRGLAAETGTQRLPDHAGFQYRDF